MPYLFGNDTYQTPAEARRMPLARLFGWSRFPFYWYVARTVLGGRDVAVRGGFDSAEFLRRSEAIVRILEGCGGRLNVSGMDQIGAAAGPAVIVGNHMSFLETFALPAMVIPRRPVSFVIKQSLLKYPGLGKILQAQAPIALSRTHAREDLRVVLEQGVQRLQDGRCLVIFPQSTRRPDFVAAKFSSIGAKVAQRAGCPVIPVAVRTDFVGFGRLIKDLGPLHPEHEVRFAFGPPIAATEARRAQEQVVEFITSRLTSWGVSCS